MDLFYLPELYDYEHKMTTRYDFVVEEMLAPGGFGKVMKVINNYTKSAYAVKTIKYHTTYVGGLDMYREAKSLCKLNHEKLVKYHNSWLEPDISDPYMHTMFTQMDFCENITLRNKIDNGLYKSPDRVRSYLHQILDGLKYIHDQGVIHRDLKPEHIFVDFLKRIKIGCFAMRTYLDLFGYGSPARAYQVDEQAGLLSVIYRAPEMLRGDRSDYDYKADIYSLGVILFEMCYKPSSSRRRWIKMMYNLRQPQVILPKDFVTRENQRKVSSLRLMMCHERTLRPDIPGVLFWWR